MNMSLERKQDLSIYYWLDDLFSPYDNVTVVDGYPVDGLVLPTVVAEDGVISTRPSELGNRSDLRERIWNIYVYAKNKTQRTDFSSFIHENLESGIIVYDYDQGFPPTVVPQIGVINPQGTLITPMRAFPELTELLYWKAAITFYDTYVKE